MMNLENKLARGRINQGSTKANNNFDVLVTLELPVTLQTVEKNLDDLRGLSMSCFSMYKSDIEKD